MTISLYNTKGEEIGTMELPQQLFNVAWNPALVHQVVTSQKNNRSQGSAHAKTRAEVSGGGRKPWAQKHTGRARHGSTRSPIWRGGGVTFGPRTGTVELKINKKMRRKALFCVLSEKMKDKEILIVDDLSAVEAKTKNIASMLTSLPCDSKRTLIALPSMNQALIRAIQNIAFAVPMQARDLNALDLLNTRYLVLPKESIQVLEETFAGKKK
ncbi:MAG: 50S ribosomal protein L4 [Candidatus Yanofskybacteria bacterium]|nr:50S ribosomal protein L4 [Candidatus Yanofskybacteria bacterium]